MASGSTAPRVLVIGLDGATYDLLTPLAEEGLLPNLAHLLRKAALTELESCLPYITPAAWATFLTGCDPGQHGVWDYQYLDAATRQVKLNDATRLAQPTWPQIVADAGGRVVSLNLPMTFPPACDPRRHLIVGGIDSPGEAAALAPYPAFARALAAAGGTCGLDTVWERAPRSFDELRANVAQTRADFLGRAAAAEVADQWYDWQAMIVQFQTLDALQHRCWHLFGLPAEPAEGLGHDPPPAPRDWVREARSALCALDEAVGRLCELAARRGASVVALSDHGFGAFREKIQVPELLRQRGLLRLPRTGISHRARRTAWKVGRWLWRRNHAGVGTAQVARPITSIVPLDWRRSRAVTLHGSLAGLVYWNRPERFGLGPLTTARLCEETAAETVAAFREATHPRTGEPLFAEVFRVAEACGVDPLERGWPDLVAIPRPGFQTRFKFGRRAELLVGDETLAGTHRRNGVLLVDAPDARPGLHAQAPLRQSAAMILRLLGRTPAAGMAEPARAPRPSLSAAGAVGSAARAAYSPSEQAMIEDRLRDLGYLD